MQLVACTQSKTTDEPTPTSETAVASPVSPTDLSKLSVTANLEQIIKSNIQDKLKDKGAKKNVSLEEQIDKDIAAYYEKDCLPLNELMAPIIFKIGSAPSDESVARTQELVLKPGSVVLGSSSFLQEVTKNAGTKRVATKSVRNVLFISNG
jgi:hypothetical protein